MNDLIRQDVVYKTQKGTPVTDSVKVAQVFGKEHKNILRAVRNIIAQNTDGMAQNCAVNWFYETTYNGANGRMEPMFQMTRDGFSLLAMSLTGATAMQFKVAFIERFRAMENAVQQIAVAAQPAVPALPTSFADALRLAANQAEQLELQQRQIAADAPKVVFATAVESSGTSCLIGELAKLMLQNGITTGEKRLFDWMRMNGYLCSKGERYNQPTQKAMEMGLFEVKKQTWTKPSGEVMTSTTTKVTGKGQIYFINRFLYNQQRQQGGAR